MALTARRSLAARLLAWDTTLVSRLHPGARLERLLIERARRDERIAIAAPTVTEVVRGLELTRDRRRAA